MSPAPPRPTAPREGSAPRFRAIPQPCASRSSSSRSPPRPRPWPAPAAPAATVHESYAPALAEARRRGLPLLVDVWAPW